MGVTPTRWQALSARAARLVPDTLFGRLALLLFVTALVSHVLALALEFELHPHRPLFGLLLDIDRKSVV